MKYNFDEEISRQGTNSVKYDLRAYLFGRSDIYPMWVADMDLPVPDFVIEAIIERAHHPVYGYTLKSKLYHESIINWLSVRHRWQIEQPWICFSPGVVSGLAQCVDIFTKPGDKIIIQSPVYPPFFTIINEKGRKLINNQLIFEDNQFKINFEQLQEQVNSGAKMLILANPHNPVGRVWKKEELHRIAEICLSRDVIMIADEIHNDIVYSPHRFTALASLDQEIASNTITFMSPSKTFNLAGLSTSYAIISDPAMRNSYKKALQVSHLEFGNIFGLTALPAAYQSGADWVDQLLVYLKENVSIVENYLKKEIPLVDFIAPEGTYLVWLNFQKLGLNDDELKKFLVEKAGLGFMHGPDFGPGGEGFQRVNIACPKKNIMNALAQLTMAVNDHKAKLE